MGNPLIRSLKLTNFLSYGDPGEEIDLQPLNVLIGPNASGKSNLIEALGMLKATVRDLPKPIRGGGGIGEWLYKGGKNNPIAEIEAIVDYPDGIMPLRYRFAFTMVGQRLELVDEAIENEEALGDEQDVFFFYRYQAGHPVLNVRTTIAAPAGTGGGRTRRSLRREDLSPEQSVLSQRKDPDQYPEITYLNDLFEGIRIYPDWVIGRDSPPRSPQPTDLPEFCLEEDWRNLGLVLNNLQNDRETKKRILELLRRFYEPIEDIHTKIQGGTVQIYIHEKGMNSPIPATRLSDGTLRYLCLLALLCDPNPPPLVCIDEPEIGLHPDVEAALADLIVEAAARTQIILTTHSDFFVSSLSEVADSVIVCERDDYGSHLTRLEPKNLAAWLETYSLGELWIKGEIGGMR